MAESIGLLNQRTIFFVPRVQIPFTLHFMLVAASQKIGAGLSTSGLAGCGLGIGVVFAALLIASAVNPFVRDDLFRVAMLGFALTEAVALFTLMVTFLVLFS